MKNDSKKRKKTLVGTVVSDKMEKTIVVKVRKAGRHPLYKKRITRHEKYKAHDENRIAKEGNTVRIVESRPFSKDKRWLLLDVLNKEAGKK